MFKLCCFQICELNKNDIIQLLLLSIVILPHVPLPLANQVAGVLERWLLSLLDAAVFVHFAIVIPALHSRPSERNQIWHTYSDRYRTNSNQTFFDHPTPGGCQGDFRGSTIQKVREIKAKC